MSLFKTLCEDLAKVNKSIQIDDMTSEYSYEKGEVVYTFFVQIPYQYIEAPDGEDTVVKISGTEVEVSHILPSEVIEGVDWNSNFCDISEEDAKAISDYINSNTDYHTLLYKEIKKQGEYRHE